MQILLFYLVEQKCKYEQLYFKHQVFPAKVEEIGSFCHTKNHTLFAENVEDAIIMCKKLPVLRFVLFSVSFVLGCVFLFFVVGFFFL